MLITNKHDKNLAIAAAEVYGNNQRILRSAQKNEWSMPQHFIMDPRTHSIRLFHNRNFAISMDNASHKWGNNAVVRPWQNHHSQQIYIHKNQFTVGDKHQLCLEFQSNKFGQNLHWWKCEKTRKQKFVVQKVSEQVARKFRTEETDFQNQVLHK